MKSDLSAAILSVTLALAACGAVNPVGPGQNPLDTLVRDLRAQQVQVTVAGAVPRSDTPYFSVAATLVKVGTEQIFVFQYATSEAAATDAAGVSPSGQPSPTVSIMWVGKPHFYRKDRLIVLYVGCGTEIPRVLDATLGPPLVVGSGLCPVR